MLRDFLFLYTTMQLKILKWLYQFFLSMNRKSKFILDKLKKEIYFYELEERDSDIYIVTFPKSGTTWMQLIVYHLLTDGNMDFKHIYDVSPWLSNQAFRGETPEAVNKLPSPRFFKSHDKYEQFNRGFNNKVIYVYREGKDVAASYFHHNKNYLQPDLTFEKNFENHFTDFDKPLNWFKFNKEWMGNKNGFNILYVSYEDLKYNLIPSLHRIAKFLEVSLTPEIISRTQEFTSFEYMKNHEEKFGEVAPVKKELVFNEFIRTGESGKGTTYFSDQQSEIFDKNFQEHLSKVWPRKLILKPKTEN
jgi:hypothetical protein